MPLWIAALCLAASPSPEERAIAYLAREVPAWSAKNQCFSCHNNGNAARALYAADRLGYALPEKALADTTRWPQSAIEQSRPSCSSADNTVTDSGVVIEVVAGRQRQLWRGRSS